MHVFVGKCFTSSIIHACTVLHHRVLHERYEKIFDPVRKRYYYYNTVEDTASWRKPLLLREEDIEHVAPTYSKDQAGNLTMSSSLSGLCDNYVNLTSYIIHFLLLTCSTKSLSSCSSNVYSDKISNESRLEACSYSLSGGLAGYTSEPS